LDLDRRAVEAVTLADAIFEIAGIGEVDGRRAVDEEHERRCGALRLGHVMKTYLLPVPITRRWVRGDGFDEETMQVGRRDPFLALVDDRDRRVQRLFDAAPGLC